MHAAGIVFPGAASAQSVAKRHIDCTDSSVMLWKLFPARAQLLRPGWNYGQGIKYWSTLEEMVCGTKLEQPQPNSQVCALPGLSMMYIQAHYSTIVVSAG